MRIVLKLGTSTLTHPTGNLNIRRVEELCKVCSDLKNAGHELVLVSSGAVAMGVGKLSLAERPKDIPGKQAAAAVGQCELMYIYDKLFSQYHHVVAQLLITADDIETPERAKNFHNTLARLLQLRTLPIINENDTVATQELGIGDNDTLAAIVAGRSGQTSSSCFRTSTVCSQPIRTAIPQRSSSPSSRGSRRRSSGWPAARAANSARAACRRNSTPHTSQRRPVCPWSLPTARSPLRSTI